MTERDGGGVVEALEEAIRVLDRACLACATVEPAWEYVQHARRRLSDELRRRLRGNPEARAGVEAGGSTRAGGWDARHEPAQDEPAPALRHDTPPARLRVRFEEGPPAARVRPIVGDARALVEAVAPQGPVTGERWCLVQQGGYGCTREAGHRGAHVAHGGGQALVLWPAVAGEER